MMKSICELYVMCGMYVESCTILVVVNRLSRPVVVLDGLPVYMGSSMTVRLLADCHCTCTLINWSVLRQLVSEQDSTLIVTSVFKTKVLFSKNPSLATNNYINRCLKPRVEI